MSPKLQPQKPGHQTCVKDTLSGAAGAVEGGRRRVKMAPTDRKNGAGGAGNVEGGTRKGHLPAPLSPEGNLTGPAPLAEALSVATESPSSIVSALFKLLLLRRDLGRVGLCVRL